MTASLTARRHGLAILLFALLCGAGPPPARAADEVRWMKVSLDGRKIGHAVHRRSAAADGTVTTTESMAIVLDRAGQRVELSIEERAVEDADGTPRAYLSETTLGGSHTRVEGRIVDGVLRVRESGIAGSRDYERPWPAGALLAEGLRLAERRAGLVPGTRYRVLAWDASLQAALPVEVSVHAAGAHDPEGSVRIAQRVEFGGSAMTMQSWVDRDHALQRATLPLLGVELELLACPEDCARAPNQPADVLERALVAAPRPLSAAERARGLRYTLRLAGEAPPALPDHPGQRVRAAGARLVVDVRAQDTEGDRRAPTAADRRANRWLESDDPEVSAFARAAAGGRDGAAARMRALEGAVRAHIRDKSLRVGYASAAATVRAGEGDCTEHALLLAAAGRALGIPTRVVNGLVYADQFAERAHVFVPHAWVQAWDGTRWRDYDAALPGHDAGHLALSYGDGDSAEFYAGVMLLGSLAIEAVEPLEATAPLEAIAP